MNAPDTRDGIERNQRLLAVELAWLRSTLERHMGEDSALGDASAPEAGEFAPLLDQFQTIFGLSPFERNVLLLCAAMELDARFSALCATAHGDARRPYPSFSLALAALPDAHWSALTPEAPLRRWHLIDVLPGDTLTLSPLRIDEKVLHHLVGISYVDVRVRDLIRPLIPSGDLPPSHQAVADRVVQLWRDGGAASRWPVIGLWGPDASAKRGILARACAAAGWAALVVRGAEIATNAAERRIVLTLLQREALLSNALIVVDDEDAATHAPPDVIDALPGPLLILAREPRRGLDQVLVGIQVERPGVAEQRDLWQAALGDDALRLDGALDMLTGHFNLDATGIRNAAVEARASVTPGSGVEPVRKILWAAARRQGTPRLEDLNRKSVV